VVGHLRREETPGWSLGVQDHDDPTWLPILEEEFGEVCRALNAPEDLREELIQVAAAALAWVEAIDRRTNPQGGNMTKFIFTKKKKLEILKKMRTILSRPNGWIKDVLENGAGGYCLLGAERKALEELYGVSYRHVDSNGAKLIGKAVVRDRGFGAVDEFNDAKKTKKKDVIALLDEMIAQFES